MSGSTFSSGGSNSTLGKGAITVGGSASNGTLKYTGATATTSQSIQHDARAAVSTVEVTNSATTLTVSSNLTTTNTANSVAGNGWALGGAGNLKLTGVISDSANATRTGTTVNKIGAGTLVLGAVNTFTGGTTVSEGVLLVNTAQTAGNSAQARAASPSRRVRWAARASSVLVRATASQWRLERSSPLATARR